MTGSYELDPNPRRRSRFLYHNGGSILTSNIADKTSIGILGETIPGMFIFKQLGKKGLVLITEEEPDEEGFCFTPSIELTEYAFQ